MLRFFKTEYVHINPANGGIELYKDMKKYTEFCSEERPHQSLEYRAPKHGFEAMNKAAR